MNRSGALFEAPTVRCERCGDPQVAWAWSERKGKHYMVRAFEVNGIEMADRYDFHNCDAYRKVAQAVGGQSRPEPTRIPVEEQGVYILPDDTIVKVKANRQKTRTYAMRWVEISGQRALEEGGRAHGEWHYEQGLIRQVAEQGRKMSLEEAKSFILRYGQCVRCGRHLKDAKSVEAGIGPVCVKYFDSPVAVAL